MQQLILAIDQGTTSARAILFDKNGDAVAKTQVGFAQIYPQPGWVEHDPMVILSSQLSAVRQTLDAAKAVPGQIIAVGITNQRETTVVWERETGRPITNAIVWQCRRTADLCEDLKARGLTEMVTQKTGLVIDPYFSGTKIRWILDNVPNARQQIGRAHV